MTIIAVDVRAGLMVADTKVNDEGVRSYGAVKIARAKDGALVGAAGSNQQCIAFMLWASNGCKGQLKAASDEITGLRLTRDGLEVFDGGPLPDDALDVVLAIGSGRIAFRAAYMAGADVIEAVRIACEIDPHCGLPLTTLRLEPEA